MSRQLFAEFQRGRVGVPRLAVTTPLAQMVGELNSYRPEVILTYPTVAALLAEEQGQGRLRIEPSMLVLASEVLSEDVRRRIHDAWGIEPFEAYATTEAAIIASGSPERVGLHVCEDLLVLEVVDEEARPVPAGTPGYKVLVTSLVNRALPLIRYEISDSVTLADGPDPSGRPYGRVERVDGRNDDILQMPARGGGELAVHPHRLRAPFTYLPDVLQYQVVEEPQCLRIRIVLRNGASVETPALVRAALARELDDAGVIAPPIEVEPVAELERDPGQGAKLKLVTSQR
jgi:phenylacetate-CoA ligase